MALNSLDFNLLQQNTQIMSLRINENDLELVGFDGGGSGMYHYQGKPFTGIMLIYNEKENYLYIEREFQNGYEEGQFRSYHKNGKVRQEYRSHNNITVEGSYKRWDENGNLVESF
jgi:antitoxin component YwqK of YwqJK toxin-antitoxin module